MAFIIFDADAKVLRVGKKWSDIEDYTEVTFIYDIATIQQHGVTCKDGGYWLNGLDEHGSIRCMISNVREVKNIGTKQ
jgi:hypothetical protein